MKPTEIQIKTIDTIVSIVKSWKNTNDINSPTLSSDIQEEIYANLGEDMGYEDMDELTSVLEDLLWLIKED